MNQWDREEKQLEDDLCDGFITMAEYNQQLQQMIRDRAAEERDPYWREQGELA